MCFSFKKKRQRFAHLNENRITDNKTFWQIVEPFLSDKPKHREIITLVEKKKLIMQDKEVAD